MAMGTTRPVGSRDPLFDAPFVDIDEWRDEPAPHRYIHGGFKGTDTRFAFHFPPPERYEGRFFHPLFAVPGNEHTVSGGFMPGTQGWIEFALSSGASFVESNQGRLNPFPGPDWSICHRSSAAVARYSRVLAADMYGEHRAYGYVFGGSGGAYKTMSCFENAIGVWDGAVPYIHPTPMSLPNLFTVQNHAIRVLRDKFPAIVDAVEPGGSGNIFAGLNAEEREALAEVTRMGFPPRAWFDVQRIASQYHGVWTMLVDNLMKWDPEYFEEFWTVPGYLGFNPPESLARARLQHKTAVTGLLSRDEAAGLDLPVPRLLGVRHWSDAPVAVRVDELPETSLEGATFTVTSGAAAGRVLYIVDAVKGVIVTGFGPDNTEGLAGVSVGDEVLIDNSVYLASQTYHRHQVHADFPQFDQFRVAGQPVYPQRPRFIGARFVRYGSGGMQTGRFAGKMIVVQNLMDEAAHPSQAEYYYRLVKAALGSRTDEHYRLWFIDHAMHGQPTVAAGDPRPVRTTRTVSYIGVLRQALRDLADWVEKGLAPPPSTEYELVDGQVFVPPTAEDRKGIQPVVSLTANGDRAAVVGPGEAVELCGVAEVPPGAGTIVSADWDFDGSGEYPVSEPGIEGDDKQITVTITHTYAEPGTYFPSLRIASQREGDPQTPHTRILNLGRTRVTVR
jgi:Tannase and feruloyl esterase